MALAMAAIAVAGSACSSTRTIKQGNEEFSVLEDKYIEALALADDGMHFEAIQAWKEVLADEPRWALAHFNLGQLYDKLDLVPEAMAEYEQAAKLDGEQPSYHLNLGTVYLRSGMPKQALEALKLATTKDPYNYIAHYDLSAAYLALKDQDNALIHADIAVDLYAKPDSKNDSGLAEGVDRDMLARMLGRQAECHILRGERDKAQQCADRIQKQCRVDLPLRLKEKLDKMPPAETPATGG